MKRFADPQENETGNEIRLLVQFFAKYTGLNNKQILHPWEQRYGMKAVWQNECGSEC